jgi:hypothetical protein
MGAFVTTSSLTDYFAPPGLGFNGRNTPVSFFWRDSTLFFGLEFEIYPGVSFAQARDRFPSRKTRLTVGPAHTRTSSLVSAPIANKEPLGQECGRDGAGTGTVVVRELVSWSRKSEQRDKWSFCLTAGKIDPRIRRDDEQTSTAEPHSGFQGEGGAGRCHG